MKNLFAILFRNMELPKGTPQLMDQLMMFSRKNSSAELIHNLLPKRICRWYQLLPTALLLVVMCGIVSLCFFEWVGSGWLFTLAILLSFVGVFCLQKWRTKVAQKYLSNYSVLLGDQLTAQEPIGLDTIKKIQRINFDALLKQYEYPVNKRTLTVLLNCVASRNSRDQMPQSILWQTLVAVLAVTFTALASWLIHECFVSQSAVWIKAFIVLVVLIGVFEVCMLVHVMYGTYIYRKNNKHRILIEIMEEKLIEFEAREA